MPKPRPKPTPKTPDLPSIVDPFTGETRLLGSLPSDPRLVAALPPYRGEVLPESELREFDDWPEHIKIKDQDGRGACNGHAAATAAEMARFVGGMDHVPLSAWWVYAILCNGVDRGSNILEAYKLTGDRGVAPESTVDYGIINPRRLTDAASQAAGRFRVELAESYQSWSQVVSAVMLREALNLSVCVGRTFNNLDAEGVVGADRGMGNHAVAVGLRLKKSAKHGWLVGMHNSWSESWGQSGHCYLSERVIEAGGYFECYGVKAVAEDPSDPHNPPIARMLANLPRKTTWNPPEVFA